MSNPHNRHQLPPEKLSSYDACPIYATIGQKNQVGESDEIPTVGIEIRNWKIKSGKSRISSESECDLLARQLQNAATLDGTDMKRLNPPEIVYFHAFLTLEYPGGFCFSFTAREALLEWADAHKYLCSNTTCNDYTTCCNYTYFCFWQHTQIIQYQTNIQYAIVIQYTTVIQYTSIIQN